MCRMRVETFQRINPWRLELTEIMGSTIKLRRNVDGTDKMNTLITELDDVLTAERHELDTKFGVICNLWKTIVFGYLFQM